MSLRVFRDCSNQQHFFEPYILNIPYDDVIIQCSHFKPTLYRYKTHVGSYKISKPVRHSDWWNGDHGEIMCDLDYPKTITELLV